jgi:diaminopimelate decarboxylase
MKQIKDLGIKLYGIHFHCGSGKDGASGFKRGIDQGRQTIKIGR